MKELEYPFDAAYIIKKRKSLKKALLADGTSRIRKKIAVFGGSTTSDIVKTLELFLLDAGIEPEFYESEYAQYFQDAMFPDETLLSFKPDIVFIHTTNRNVTDWPEMTDTTEQIDEKLHTEINRFTAMWKSIAEKFHCPIIQNNFEMPLYRLLGSRDAWDIHGRTNFLTRLNEAFYAYARENESFYIHDLNFVSADYGLKEWSNPLFWNMYKYAMCFEAIPSFAFSVSHIIKSIFGKNKKALALDLDNTLWGGVVGDDGVDGIEIGQETGVSQSYYEFQTYVKQLKSLGIVLTVCSKNDHENAIAGLNHPEGALRPDDFVIIKANWENKDRNIAETAAELNILPDSIVFADDNPAEREIVRTQIKGAAVPDMDGVENYITTIDRSGFFEVTTFSEDDLKRNEMYKKNALRAAEMASFGDYNDYLKSLEMHAVIDDFIPVSQGAKAIQTHRKAKNLNSDTAILDAVIEEMNNTIFRKGHIQLGFSSALIGSGMVFDFQWFKQNIIHTHSAGEDKELEELLLSQGIHIEYADSIETLDEKVQKADSMRHQRRRWMATQLFLALKMGSNLPSALLHGNRDYLLKTIQTFILPRSILIAVLSTISLICSIISPFSSVKWWILFILLTLSLYIAIPPDMRHKYAGKIIKQLPYFTIIMTLNLFHLKGMANKFIHTQHGQL